jgi:putative mRNA 3-end processing factor
MSERSDLLQVTDRGLWCAAGDFHIDPWLPVPRAVITHAHGDHARWGSAAYLCAAEGAGVLRARMGDAAVIDARPYGEAVDINGVRVSLHPAGHILGSSQVRIEYRGEVWCVSGDYKTQADPTCTPFELVRCDTFVTESTFGLPIFRWRAQSETFDRIEAWWRLNIEAGRASVLLGYALGKAQRLLSGMIGREGGPIYTHGAVERLNAVYRAEGIALPETKHAAQPRGTSFANALIIAPPSAGASNWLRRFGAYSAAFASGWMQVRGMRRRRGVDRGFVLSDHVDWPSLLSTISATGASRVLVTHGYREPVVKYLCERGIDARVLPSRWKGELDDDSPEGAAEDGGASQDSDIADTDTAPGANE